MHGADCFCEVCRAGEFAPEDLTAPTVAEGDAEVELQQTVDRVLFEVWAITRQIKRKYGGNTMRVGGFVQEGEQHPWFDAAACKKAKGVAKVLGVRRVSTANLNGLVLELKAGDKKYAYSVRFDRFDLGAIVGQLGTDETDDWLGKSIKFVVKKGKKGAKFVNVARAPMPKKVAKKGKGRRRGK